MQNSPRWILPIDGQVPILRHLPIGIYKACLFPLVISRAISVIQSWYRHCYGQQHGERARNPSCQQG
jgi:hypothetical protein